MKTIHLLCSAALVASAHADFTPIIRRYDGMVGEKQAASLILNARKNHEGVAEYSGSFHYLNDRKVIPLSQQEFKNGMLIFHQNERWDESKQEVVNSGIWSVKIGENFVNGMLNTTDGKTNLPIDLIESYPAGSFKMTVHAFEDSWKAKSGEKEIGDENLVSFVQFQGETPGISAINLALRKQAWTYAWTSAQSHSSEKTATPPEEISISDIAKATKLTQPADLKTWESECIEQHSNRMSVLTNDSDVICVGVNTSAYLGGAHGIYGIGYRNFDATTGQQLKLADFMNPGFEKRWAELGAAVLRREAGKPSDAKLSECGLFEDKLELNENFYITVGGIGFSYNPYEISSYAQGIVEFVLPWKDIAQDLKPGTKVAELAAKNAE